MASFDSRQLLGSSFIFWIRQIPLLFLLVQPIYGGLQRHMRDAAFDTSALVVDGIPSGQEPPATVNVDYPFPYINGHPIDSCLSVLGTSGDCGRMAADFFCRFQNCEAAVSFQESSSDRGPTWIAGDETIRDAGGKSFDNITCQCSVPNSIAPGSINGNQIIYESPRILNHPVDFCLEKNNVACGKPAADAFCESFGNSGSTRFVEDPRPTLTTWLIGDHSVSEAPDRHSFRYV